MDVQKCPVRLELLLSPDASGLKLKQIEGVFVYKFPQDPFAGGAEKTVLMLGDEDMKLATVLFESAMQAFIKRHETLSVEEAVKLYPPPKQ